MDFRAESNKAWKAFLKENGIDGAISLADISRYERPIPKHGDTWGNWRYDSRTLVLTHAVHRYEIDLEQCVNSAEILDWIFQVAGKTWASPKDVGDLVRAIDDLLDPQAHVCSWGKNKQFDVTKHLKALNRRAAAKNQQKTSR